PLGHRLPPGQHRGAPGAQDHLGPGQGGDRRRRRRGEDAEPALPRPVEAAVDVRARLSCSPLPLLQGERGWGEGGWTSPRHFPPTPTLSPAAGERGFLSCRVALMLVDLVQTLTRDGVRLDGAYQAPPRPGSAGLAVDAFVFLHGTGGSFYSSTLFDALAERLL